MQVQIGQIEVWMIKTHLNLIGEKMKPTDFRCNEINGLVWVAMLLHDI